MRKKGIKEYFVFGVIAVISVGLILATTRIGSKKYYPFDDSNMQIVFLGDSNIANYVEGKTIPDRVAEMLHCDVYNAAVGGTTAAKVNTDNYFDRSGDLFCLYNISRIMEIEEYQLLLDSYDSLEYNETEGIGKMNMLVNIEYDKIDYVVISYGMNDYLAGIALGNDAEPYDETTFEGALRSAIERIQSLCPNSTIIISGITYCAYTDSNDPAKDGYNHSWGGGYISDYRDSAQKVAAEYDNIVFMDSLELMDIDATNYEQYLWDGIHFELQAQELYAECLVDVITEVESNKDE